VTTQQNDIARTGRNLAETILNTSNVNPTQFGKIFVQPVTGVIYAQPLYLSGVTLNGASHNVVYVATRADYVYAFDAGSNNGANASALWAVSLLDAAHGASVGAQVYGTLGITSTPVIDPASGTLYVVGASFEGGQVIYRLHALDVTTGLEKFGGPATITGGVPGAASDSVAGVVSLTPRNHNQRPGLLLLNGVVYIGFGSYTEGDDSVWHGWIVGYGASSLVQTGIFCATPNGSGGGVWLSGQGLAADQLDLVNHPYGRMFISTGNGDFTGTPPYIAGMDFGDSVVDLDLTGGAPSVTDDFTPSIQAVLGTTDGDQGAGGALILPTQSAGAYPNLLVQAGKSGTVYLLDRDNLGGYTPTGDQAVQVLPLAVGTSGPNAKTGVWSSPAYWNGNVYYWGVYDNLKSFPLVGGLLSTPPTTSSELSGFPSSTPSISANGAAQGIVWNILGSGSGTAILMAHDAGNVATTLYSSATNPGRDAAGPQTGFVVPTIANGMVYVGTANQLDVYGLINAAQTSVPTIATGPKSFVGSVSVAITDSTPNAVIYYTTDGSAPSTASTPYVGPILVTSNQTINAVASTPGLALSNQTSATYTIAATAVPTFSPAAVAYSSAVPVTISDATTGAVIYYTIDGTTPTISSSVYTGPVMVSASQTLMAIALAPGYSASSVGSATYEISSSSTILVNDSAGFSSLGGLNPVGTVTLTNNALQLSVAAGGLQGNAVWNTAPLNVQAFTTDFYFQETSATADGFTFTLQNSPAGLSAVGSGGSGLGYKGLASSVAVKFDLFDNMGEGIDSTGFYTNGAAPTIPTIDMTGSGVNLHGTDILHAHITYDGTTLALALSDTVTSASFTASTAINIPGIVGGATAYAGFTAGASNLGATQSILNWTYVAGSGSALDAATPTFTPVSGAYAGPQWATIADATPGAIIYYTIDGTMPTIASPVYASPIAASSNETISAIAAANGYVNSEVGFATYQFAAPAPTFTPPPGIYLSPQSVSIGDVIGGTTIYYTTNGTKPTTSSTVYSSPISVSANETLKAIALASGVPASAVGVATYQIRTAAPSFTPARGTYSGAQSVTISDAVGGATIYYTTDGTTPTTSSAVYSGPISVSGNEILRAIAAISGNASSPVVAATYKIRAATPTFTPAGGTYSGAQEVAINDAVGGATIYYSTDGTVPTTSSAVYSGAISVSADETLRAIAAISGGASSPGAAATYKIRAATPTFTPAGGTYSGAQEVAINDAVGGATIYYTTDGTTPTTSSVVYSGPITVSVEETLKANAVAAGYSSSLEGTAVYKISP
jgi:hypothetical protein